MKYSSKKIAEKAENIVSNDQFQRIWFEKYEKKYKDKSLREVEDKMHIERKIFIKMLSDAISSYFDTKDYYDKAPKPKEIISQIEDLRQAARKLKLCINGLNSATRGILAFYRSKKDDRNVNEVLASIIDNTSWLEKKAGRVSKLLSSRSPGDKATIVLRYFTGSWKTGHKGGRNKLLSNNVFIEHLKNVYLYATGKEPSHYPSASKKDGLGPFGQFVRICFSELGESELTIYAIAKRIRKSSEAFSYPHKNKALPIS